MLKKIQSSIQCLLKKFYLDGFQEISILLEETVINMKKAILGNDSQDSLSITGKLQDSKNINVPMNTGKSEIIDNFEKSVIHKTHGPVEIKSRNHENCMGSFRNHRRGDNISNRHAEFIGGMKFFQFQKRYLYSTQQPL